MSFRGSADNNSSSSKRTPTTTTTTTTNTSSSSSAASTNVPQPPPRTNNNNSTTTTNNSSSSTTTTTKRTPSYATSTLSTSVRTSKKDDPKTTSSSSSLSNSGRRRSTTPRGTKIKKILTHKPGSSKHSVSATSSDSDIAGGGDGTDTSSNRPLWICQHYQEDPVPIYNSPNGHQVGETIAGTVIEEYKSFVDMFGAQWIASLTANDNNNNNNNEKGGENNNNNNNNNSLVWVRRYEKGDDMCKNRVACWKLKDSNNSNSSNNNASSTDVSPSRLHTTSTSSTATASAVSNAVSASSSAATAAAAGMTEEEKQQQQKEKEKTSLVPPELNSQICHPSKAPLKHQIPTATLDFNIIFQYFEMISKNRAGTIQFPSSSSVRNNNQNGPRDWNTEYQSLLEQLMFGKFSPDNNSPKKITTDNNSNSNNNNEEEKDENEKGTEEEQKETFAIRESIHKLFTEFATEIETGVTTIINELSVPANEKQIKPFIGTSGSVVLGTYFYNGIMYRMNVDSISGAYQGDKNAMKIASQNLQANSFLGQVTPLFHLHQPLMMVMTYRGFRITCSSIPPLHSSGSALVAGSLDGGKSFYCPTGFWQSLFDDCFEELGLCPHQVRAIPSSVGAGIMVSTTSEATTSSTTSQQKQQQQKPSKFNTPLPYDMAIIAGRDHRLYTMNVTRCLPPVAPVKNHPLYSNHPAVNALFWRMRPELVNRVDFRLSSDAFVPTASQVEDNEDAAHATQLLRDEAIPQVAAVFGFLEPTLAPTEDLDSCCGCKKPSESHLAFAVCSNDCCKICPQCNLEISKLAFWDHKFDEAEEKVKNCVRCENGTPRMLKGFKMIPDVTTTLHSHGVNLRYLNLVYQKIPRSAFHCTAHFLEIEMICRSAKHLLSEILRKSADSTDANAQIAQFFVSLLQPSGSQAEKFWAEQLGPAIMKKFDVVTPFDTEILDRDLVYHRLSELTGVQFSPDSVKSLMTEKPFVQMLPPQPVLKAGPLPQLVSRVGERRDYLAKYSGLIQVYLNDCLDETEVEKKIWEEKKPLHYRFD